MTDTKLCAGCKDEIHKSASICKECGTNQNFLRHLKGSGVMVSLLVALVSVITSGLTAISSLEKDEPYSKTTFKVISDYVASDAKSIIIYPENTGTAFSQIGHMQLFMNGADGESASLEVEYEFEFPNENNHNFRIIPPQSIPQTYKVTLPNDAHISFTYNVLSTWDEERFQRIDERIGDGAITESAFTFEDYEEAKEYIFEFDCELHIQVLEYRSFVEDLKFLPIDCNYLFGLLPEPTSYALPSTLAPTLLDNANENRNETEMH